MQDHYTADAQRSIISELIENDEYMINDFIENVDRTITHVPDADLIHILYQQSGRSAIAELIHDLIVNRGLIVFADENGVVYWCRINRLGRHDIQEAKENLPQYVIIETKHVHSIVGSGEKVPKRLIDFKGVTGPKITAVASDGFMVAAHNILDAFYGDKS